MGWSDAGFEGPEEERKKKEEEQQLKPRERVYVDCITVDEADINGHDSLLVTKCQKTEYPKVLSLPDQEAETALGKYRTLYPGTVQSGSFPATTVSDNGPEFRKPFIDGIAAAGGSHVASVPLRPQSNAKIERFIQELQKGVAAAMAHARAPYKL